MSDQTQSKSEQSTQPCRTETIPAEPDTRRDGEGDESTADEYIVPPPDPDHATGGVTVDGRSDTPAESAPSRRPVDPTTGHRRVVAPSGIERAPTEVRTDETWTRSYWIGEFPELPMPGFLSELYTTATNNRSDITLHLEPRETEATLDSIENRIEDLEADVEYLTERRRAGARGAQADLEAHRSMYDVLRNTATRAFDASLFLTVRAPEADGLDDHPLVTRARQSPANLTPILPRWRQRDAVTAASPVGLNPLAETMEPAVPMLGDAVGATFPFVSGAFAEGGVEYGTHAANGSPLLLDRFERETGYCMLVIGKLGAGKSFSTQLHTLRRAMYDGDTRVVLLDPLQEFGEVVDALDGERVTVGGRRALNPLEIRAVSDAVHTSTPDIDPWSQQITKVMAFFETFFADVANNPLGDRSQTLRRAIQAAYERRGITPDPDTHDLPSPTIRDVLVVLEDMVETPGAFDYATAAEQTELSETAQSLLVELRPSFRSGGDLSNLARGTELDLDDRLVHLDLHQQEGLQGNGRLTLVMQVLFNTVYERAKATDDRVVFVVDEAHYLLNDGPSRAFLETAVRHSRHYDLSIQFVTQTSGEFALTPEARTIANLCSLTLIHRVAEAGETLGEWFDLNERELDWVQTAAAGDHELGYSEALLGIDEEGWFPLRVRASDIERSVIETGIVADTTTNTEHRTRPAQEPSTRTRGENR